MMHRAPIWGRHRFIPGFFGDTRQRATPRKARAESVIVSMPTSPEARVACEGIKFLQVHSDPAAPAPTLAKLSIPACY